MVGRVFGLQHPRLDHLLDDRVIGGQLRKCSATVEIGSAIADMRQSSNLSRDQAKGPPLSPFRPSPGRRHGLFDRLVSFAFLKAA